MKNKLIFLLCISSSLFVNSQTSKSEVKVTNQYGQTSTYNVETRKSGANQALINGAAKAAPKFNDIGKAFSAGFNSTFNNVNYNSQPVNLMESKTLINLDLLKGNKSSYKYVAIKSVSGWSARQNLTTIQELIANARKLIPLNALMVQNTKEHKISNELYRPEITMMNDQTLVLDFHRTAINNNDRATKVVLTNSKNEVVFEGEFINVPHIEMLKPILTDYDFTQEEIEQEKKELELNSEAAKNKAIDELKKLKELLDLGLLTKEEFDSKATELKKIILK